MERVVWRSKQALDFSFLMMYAQSRATFYVQVNATVWHTLLLYGYRFMIYYLP
jgi:hypothetical protein